jgi:hypothetical protein
LTFLTIKDLKKNHKENLKTAPNDAMHAIDGWKKKKIVAETLGQTWKM